MLDSAQRAQRAAHAASRSAPPVGGVGRESRDASDELLRGADPAALLTLDGAIRSLNAAMATAFGRPAEQCLGHDFGDLWPASQRMSAESLVVHAARTKTVAMRVGS
ncbi:PAS domain-containing protein [Streptomyces sp. NPDC001982]|uniref:PAS domain-containing protein n=1 Tax=Streptomyces sp. NPDC001982 TaxID=3154405 RepID=UPI00331C5CC7